MVTNENMNVVFKRELTEKIEKEVVAFLNSKGGHLYIGVNDDGSIEGVDNPDEVQLDLKNRIADKISPSPLGYFEILTETENGKTIVHLVVASGNEKPYYIKKKGMCPEGTYTRVGSSAVPMTEKQIYDLFIKRTRTSIRNILSPVQNLTFRQLKIYYEENGYQFSDNTYSQLGFYTEENRYNYLAYLVSDENALVFNIGIFEGNNVVNLKETYSYSDQSLIKTAFEITERIENCNRTFTEITYPVRKEKKLFDPIAVREAVINALVHSDYSYENVPTFRLFDDHLEIISVGGIPEGVEENEFLAGYMSPKNPSLMKIFRDVKLVEHMGTGIIRILEKYDKSVYVFTPNFIKVSIPFNKKEEPSMVKEEILQTHSERWEMIESMISVNPHITQDAMAKAAGVTRFTIIRDLKKMEEEGRIERIGSNKTGTWKLINNKHI